MGLEKAPTPRTNVPKNLPEVKIQSDNPDDVRDLEKKQAAKKVLAKLPGGEKSIGDVLSKLPEKKQSAEDELLKILGQEQLAEEVLLEDKKSQAELMAELTDIDIDEENDKLSKVKIAGADELKKRA